MSETPTSPQPNGIDWRNVSSHLRGAPYFDYPGGRQAMSAATILATFSWLMFAASVVGGLLGAYYGFAVYALPAMVVGILQSLFGVMFANFVKVSVTYQIEVGTFVRLLRTAPYS